MRIQIEDMISELYRRLAEEHSIKRKVQIREIIDKLRELGN
ncbi:MAG: hypothetical protein AABW59_00380 [archaeon]